MPDYLKRTGSILKYSVNHKVPDNNPDLIKIIKHQLVSLTQNEYLLFFLVF